MLEEARHHGIHLQVQFPSDFAPIPKLDSTRFPLSELMDPQHRFFTLAKIMPWRTLEQLVLPFFEASNIPEGQERREFLALLFLIELYKLDPIAAYPVLGENIAYQYLCGLTHFTREFGSRRQKFSGFFRSVQESGIRDRLRLEFIKAIKQNEVLHSSHDNSKQIFEGIEYLHKNFTLERHPAVFELEFLQVSEGLIEKLTDLYAGQGWTTALISKRDPFENNKNLRKLSPRFTHIPSSNAEVSRKAIEGIGPYYDVVVQEPTEKNIGRVIFHTPRNDEPFIRLECALQKVPSLRALLDDPLAQEHYHSVLALYFGKERFPKPAFEVIASQLRKMIERLPELETLLWEPISEPWPEIQLTTAMTAYGREVNLPLFEKYIDRLLKPEGEESSRMPPWEMFALLKEQIAAVKRFEEDSNLSRKGAQERRAAAASFYQKWKSDPRFTLACRTLLRNYLLTEEPLWVLKSGHSDMVLDFFKQLRQNPVKILTAQGLSDTEYLASALRHLIPTTQDLLSKIEIFPPMYWDHRHGKKNHWQGLAAMTYRFRPVTRRLHGIWRGIPAKECCGGDPGQLDETMPERWLSHLISGSRLYFVEKSSGGFIASAQLTPFSLRGHRCFSLGVNWSGFFQKTALRSEESQRVSTLFEAFVSEAEKQIPEDITGIAVSHTQAFHSLAELEVLRSLPCYQLGKRIGAPNDVSFIDPLSTQIIETSRGLGFGGKYRKNYSENMIIDGTINDGGPIVLLKKGAC